MIRVMGKLIIIIIDTIIFSIPLLHHLYFPFPFVSSSSYGMILYADHYMTWMDLVAFVVVVS